MTRRTVLLQAGLVAAVLLACVAALVVMVSQKAEATFPGQNGKIAYTSPQSYVPGADDYEIYTINPDGGGKFNVTNNEVNDYLPDFSPDGKRIAYSRYDGRDDELYTVNADGGGRVRLTNNSNSDDIYPAYSPDGKKIAFARDPGPGDRSDSEIFVMTPRWLPGGEADRQHKRGLLA